MPNFVVGLDGAHWELLDPWIEGEKLPTLARIKDEGVWGDIQSCLPPVTSPNWKCYSTGKNPGKLGVYWWEVMDIDAGEVHTPKSHEYRSAELWDYLNDEGYSVGVVNMPTTFPPREIDGWLIAGGPGTDDTGYTHPAGLERELENAFDYRVHPDHGVSARDDFDEQTLESFHEAIDSRFRVATWLADEKGAEFVHVTIFYINVLQHFFWDHEYTLEAWQLIDDWLGRLLDEGHSMVLMADHGSNQIRWEFHVNRWLQEKGYLVLRDSVSSGMGRLGLTRDRLHTVLDVVPFDHVVRKLAPARLTNRIPDAAGQVPRRAKTDLVDWERSEALASGQGPIYLLAESEERRVELYDILRRELDAVRDPDGSPVFSRIYEASEIYHGPYLDSGPDLVVDQHPGYHLPGSIAGTETFRRPSRWAGENKRTALFAAWGDEFGAKERLAGNEDRSITDVMPTVLHWHGGAIPDDVDGNVQDVFAPGSTPAETEPSVRDPLEHWTESRQSDVSDATTDRLEDLGYL